MHIYLAHSVISGLGVFAGRNYEIGEWVMSFNSGKPKIVSYAETVSNPANYVQVGINQYIYPAPPALYINHSCQPNAGIRETTEIIALTKIETGTEITFDYSTCIAEDPWEMDCFCGAAHCRKRIREFKHLPTETQLFYTAQEVVPGFCIKTVQPKMSAVW